MQQFFIECCIFLYTYYIGQVSKNLTPNLNFFCLIQLFGPYVSFRICLLYFGNGFRTPPHIFAKPHDVLCFLAASQLVLSIPVFTKQIYISRGSIVRHVQNYLTILLAGIRCRVHPAKSPNSVW